MQPVDARAKTCEALRHRGSCGTAGSGPAPPRPLPERRRGSGGSVGRRNCDSRGGYHPGSADRAHCDGTGVRCAERGRRPGRRRCVTVPPNSSCRDCATSGGPICSYPLRAAHVPFAVVGRHPSDVGAVRTDARGDGIGYPHPGAAGDVRRASHDIGPLKPPSRRAGCICQASSCPRGRGAVGSSGSARYPDRKPS